MMVVTKIILGAVILVKMTRINSVIATVQNICNLVGRDEYNMGSTLGLNIYYIRNLFIKIK